MTAPRPQQSEARERVLNAAYTLFVQSGFNDVSMQQIADESAITKATLYHHFRDKQDLYIETMRVAITHNVEDWKRLAGDATDIRTAMRTALDYQFGSRKADIHRLAADFRQYVDEESQKQFWKEYRRPWEMIRPFVEAGMAQGELAQADVGVVSRYLIGVLSGLAQIYRIEHPNESPPDDLMTLWISMTLNGLRPTIPEQ